MKTKKKVEKKEKYIKIKPKDMKGNYKVTVDPKKMMKDCGCRYEGEDKCCHEDCKICSPTPKKPTKGKCKHDDYEIMMDIFAKQLVEVNAKIWKRCALEGCRYGYKGFDKKIKDNCIYCGEPRQGYFDTDGSVLSIREHLKKIKPKVLK